MIRKIYLLLFASVLISSCSSDDGDSDGSSIVGTWDAVEFNTAVGVDFNQDGTASQNLLDELDCFASTVTFNADGTYSTATTSIFFEGTSESDFSITCDGVETTTGTYELNGNTLVTTDDDGAVEATVSVTKDRLVVEGDDDEFGEVSLVFERR